ncbi:MAG: hypothetical protein ACRDA7_01265 [Metamycoplasmataceae bacterium]
MCNTRYIKIKDISEIFDGNLCLYKNITEVSSKIIKDENVFEIFANYDCFLKDNIPLITSLIKKSGYDGIFLDKNNRIFFLEAKYHRNSRFNKIIQSCNTTLDKITSNRFTELNDTKRNLNNINNNNQQEYIYEYESDIYTLMEKECKNESCIKNNCKLELFFKNENNWKKIKKIKKDENLENSLLSLNEYLGDIQQKNKKINIKSKEKVIYIANNLPNDKNTRTDSFEREVVCVSIEK